MKKHSVYALIYVIFPLIIIIFVISSFFTPVKMSIEDEQITLTVPQCSTTILKYKDISNIKICSNLNVGKKEKGVNDGKYYAGYFSNEEYNSYFAFIHCNVNKYIIITSNNYTYVINDTTIKKTEDLYENIVTYSK